MLRLIPVPLIFLRLAWMVGLCLVFWGCQPRVAPPPPVVHLPPPPLITPGPSPRLVHPAQAPALAALLQTLALRYEPDMTQEERDQDYREKVAQARQALNLIRMIEMRERSLDLIATNGGEVSWEYLRRQKWPDGSPVGVSLLVPVWAPSQARSVATFAGFASTWQEIAQTMPRPSGQVLFAGNLKDINAKDRYRTASISFEVNSLHAPLAALLLEYIYREGAYEPAKRIPILVVRGGEDTYAASAFTGPVTVEGLTYPDTYGADLNGKVVRLTYNSMADIHHGRHAKFSNHRLGCALDINDFNFKGLVDGIPNPISGSLRQNNRDGLHRLDARNLPAWVFQAAKQAGYRIPQEWTHVYNTKDWPHFDCGTK
ncbi:MAG TPA: hypothetical protein DCY27_06615 [Desulfobacterales bacterium]|nr:hypothetical protein [Desulfobacterales bacterium]